MKLSPLLRTSVVLALCLLLGLPALPQTNGSYGNIGPSKGEIIGIPSQDVLPPAQTA